MKIVMLGSGAVGSYFGAKLHQAGHDVVFVARGQTLRTLREHGITLREADQETTVQPVSVTDDMGTIGPADYVLISVKTWQLAAVLPQLTLLQGPRTRFLTLQNGVEAPHIVAGVVGIPQTLGGMVRGFFQTDAPGTVRHVGIRPAIHFGQIDGTRTSEAEQLDQCLRQSGVHAEIPDNIDFAMWEKFMLVTSLGGVGAVTRSSIGEIRDHAPTWHMLGQVIDEIVGLARRHNITMAEDTTTRALAYMRTFPAEATTSMQRDIVSGLPSELEAQTGAVVRMGKAVSFPTPVNAFIYDSLFLQEQRAQGKGTAPDSKP